MQKSRKKLIVSLLFVLMLTSCVDGDNNVLPENDYQLQWPDGSKILKKVPTNAGYFDKNINNVSGFQLPILGIARNGDNTLFLSVIVGGNTQQLVGELMKRHSLQPSDVPTDTSAIMATVDSNHIIAYKFYSTSKGNRYLVTISGPSKSAVASLATKTFITKK